MSISESTRAAENGRLDEVRSTVNTQTFEGAQGTSELTAMTKAEQAASLSTAVGDDEQACPSGASTRTFNVSAIQVDIVYNKYGQHDPNGVMYVLDEKKDDVRRQVENSPDATIEDPDMNATSELVQPLTIRAHVGDCVKIRFTNELEQAATMSPSGLSYNPDSSAGSAVGYNNESVAQPGETVTYTWHVEKKGAYAFTDKAQVVMHDGDDTYRQHGLFGSLVAYEEDERWLDPETGEPLKSGAKAMITDADGPDYRDFAVYYHDDAGVVNADGTKTTWQNSTAEQHMYTINYRGDPTGARLEERNESACPDCDKPEAFYSSWIHGDPGGGDLVFPTYLGDPVKWRLVGGAVEENHVDHHHGHRWKSEPGDADSNTQDAQTISPGATYTREFVAGFGNGSARTAMGYEEAFETGAAGYVQGSPGDYIFHCHLFPHYANGMWAIMRVYDKDTREMNQSAPGVEKLQPLPDRDEPPAPNSSDPGYPNFIPAKEDHRPPKPPGEPDGREPTELEESAMNGSGTSDPIVPGAPYSNPCPEDATVQQYNISIIKTNITYNKAGDYDDDAHIYVLSEDVDEIRNGTEEPRPLVIRANRGQCVEIKLTNELPADEEPNEISMHVHFVGYDTLGSDGVTNGYNYDEGAEPVGDDESRLVSPKNGSDYRVNSTGTKYYRWYADERGTIFWHDHLSGFEKGMHGMFGALIVEPKGSKWLDPETGEPIRTGIKAMIEDPNGQNHREFVLHYQDFVRLHRPDGEEINGPHSHDLEDQGTMGISYSNAPLYHRSEGDSAHAFSSWKHGDPKTPLLRTYPDEPVKIRVLQGTFEEAHNFMISGVRWRQEQYDRNSPLKGVQTFGVSEQYVASFDAPEDNPADLEVEDHLYGSLPADDIWNGMWGLMRVYGSEVDDLEPLPGHSAPSGVINESERELLNETDDAPPKAPTPGNPCPVGADERAYTVVAFQADVSYNDDGDHDPYGVVFATEENYLDWKNNGTELEPLVLRAEEGECLDVTLVNELPENMSQHSDHAKVPVDSEKWNNSNRISLHSTLLNYTSLYSAGITAGYNYDQTAGPGETITYRWYADEQVGTTSLFDMADVRNHKHHGAYGALIVEPEGSKWLDPETGEPGKETGTRAIIVQPNGTDFREYVVVAADGQYIVNPDGTCVVTPGDEANGGAPCNQVHGDPEDQGYKSINYAAESLTRRLDGDAREHLVFSSTVHGDPATPVFEAYRGDPVKFRVTMGADKPRMLSFRLGGHVFPYQSTEQTQYVGVRGEIGPGSSVDVVPLGGAGGPQHVSGDYYYGASKLRNYVEGGMWGIFRVHDEPADVEPLPDRRPEPPTNLSVETPDRERTLDLDWDDHPNPDVEGYNVYRAAKSGGPYTKVNDGPVASSSYRDGDLLPGTTYYYVVTAVDTYGQESDYSAEANNTTKPLLEVGDVGDNVDDVDDEIDAVVRGEVEVEIEAESEAELDEVEFRVKDGPTEVRFRVEDGEIDTSGDAVVEATMDPENATYTVVWDTDAEADGDHDLRIRAKDTDGRQTARGRTVRIDNTRPDAEIEVDHTLSSELDATLTGDVALDVNTTDNTTGVDAVRYRIDDGTWENLTEQNGTWSGSVDTSTLADGSHELEVETEDGAGNVLVEEISIETDNTAPAFDAEIDGSAADTLDTALNENVSVDVNASDSVSGVDVVKLKIDDGNWKKLEKGNGKWKKTIKTDELSDGGHKLKLKAVDKVGNGKHKTFDVEVDNTDPSEATDIDGTDVSLLDDPVSDTVEIGVDADDATSSVDEVEIELDDGGWETITDSDGDGVWETDLDTTTLTDGAHTLDVRVTDGAGNAKTATYDFEADNTDPEFDAYIDGTLISLLDTLLSGDVTLEVDATDDLAGVETVEFEIDDSGYDTVTDGDDDGVWETTIDTTKYDNGDHVIRVKVIDQAGNKKIKEFEISIDNTL